MGAGRPELQALCQQYGEQAQSWHSTPAAGANRRAQHPDADAARALCCNVADNEQDALIQLAAVLAVVAVWPDSAPCSDLAKLPREVSERIRCQSGQLLAGLRRGYLPRRFRRASFPQRWRKEAARAVRAVATRDRAVSPCRGFARSEIICCWSGCISGVAGNAPRRRSGNASLMTIG
ncbi:hypothetical protein MJ585_10640 [Klebsiella pneumoniae]|nr:hypothetical protein MJ585_10640 [Klebsiella pneumoniae]